MIRLAMTLAALLLVVRRTGIVSRPRVRIGRTVGGMGADAACPREG